MAMRSEFVAVIFDYYETLAELSFSIRARAFDDLARRVGADLAPGEAFRDWRERTAIEGTVATGSQLRPSLDGPTPPFRSFRDNWLERSRRLFQHWGIDMPAKLGVDACADLHAKAAVYRDVPRVLATLRGGYRLGLLADADQDFLETSIRRNDLTFDAIVTSEELRVYKPHISLFREACARLAVDPTQTAYVGDRPWHDIEGARHAGMLAVWMNREDAAWPKDQDPPAAAVTSLDELVNLLDGRATL